MTATKIRWTQKTWNPVTGCSRVSPGCEHCYAEALSLRFGWSKKPWKAQFAAENVVLRPERLDSPAHWRKPQLVFVNSMSDLFHELVPFDYIDRVFNVMLGSGCQHTYQILTKRPERMRSYALDRCARDGVSELPGNIWLGTSVEDQRRARERIPLLLDTPAAVRFLSCEPLLGLVDLRPWLWRVYPDQFTRMWMPPWIEPRNQLRWVIVGGESGPHYRPMDLNWARTIRDQCREAGVPYFFKQSSGPRTEMGQELDGRRWEMFPGDAYPARATT